MPNFIVAQPAIDLVDVATEDANGTLTEALDVITNDLADWFPIADFVLVSVVATRTPEVHWTTDDSLTLHCLLQACEADDIPFEVRAA